MIEYVRISKLSLQEEEMEKFQMEREFEYRTQGMFL